MAPNLIQIDYLAVFQLEILEITSNQVATKHVYICYASFLIESEWF